MIENNRKEVDFNTYCPRCEYYDQKDVSDPCNDCMAWGYNINSKKPVFFKEKDNAKKDQ